MCVVDVAQVVFGRQAKLMLRNKQFIIAHLFQVLVLAVCVCGQREWWPPLVVVPFARSCFTRDLVCDVSHVAGRFFQWVV